MDSRLKNLREWVLLLFFLFCVLDIAGVQYGMKLAETASLHPNPVVGQIAAMIHGSRGAWHSIYVTERQELVFYGFLGSAGVALLATLALIVAHGIIHTRTLRAAARPAAASARRKR